jgi:hypothetical protein
MTDVSREMDGNVFGGAARANQYTEEGTISGPARLEPPKPTALPEPQVPGPSDVEPVSALARETPRLAMAPAWDDGRATMIDQRPADGRNVHRLGFALAAAAGE